MSVWFWNMYRCCRGIGFSHYKSFKMAWGARRGPDPKVIEAARQYRRIQEHKEKSV